MRLISILVILTVMASGYLSSASGICDQENLTIGALLPMSGDWASTGLSAQIALEHAEDDINNFLSDMNKSTRIKIVVKDTRTDPAATFEALRELEAQGVRIIIGPEDSASLSGVREYANQSGIILISCGSTAPSLAIPGDTTFRLASDDTNLANAMADLMIRDGAKAVVALARNDVWGNDLISAAAESLNQKGRVTMTSLRYNPDSDDFSKILGELGTLLEDIHDVYDDSEVAVFMISFDESIDILFQASRDQLLASARWYGSDPSGVLVRENESAAEFAIKVGFKYPTFSTENSSVARRIAEDIRERHGIDMVSYAMNNYDAAWLIAYTYLVTGSSDPADFIRTLPIFARTFRGYSGDLVLNDAGDRAFAFYTFWSLRDSDGIPKNVPLIKYIFNPYEGVLWSPANEFS